MTRRKKLKSAKIPVMCRTLRNTGCQGGVHLDTTEVINVFMAPLKWLKPKFSNCKFVSCFVCFFLSLSQKQETFFFSLRTVWRRRSFVLVWDLSLLNMALVQELAEIQRPPPHQQTNHKQSSWLDSQSGLLQQHNTEEGSTMMIANQTKIFNSKMLRHFGLTTKL